MGLFQSLTGWWQRLFPVLTLGRRGEQAAARYLRRRGYKILSHSDRSRPGELDLVARDGRTLVFVEVRSRARDDFGGAGASISAGKRRRIVYAARHFLRRYQTPPPCRFDAVLLQADRLIWLKAAFEE